MKKKIAIVTGASRGLGMEVAQYLADEDYFVILLARDEKKLADTLNKIQEKGKQAVYYSVDVSIAAEVKVIIEKIVTEHGRIDLLFNNAGILKHGTTNLPDEDVDELLKINLNGAIYVAKYVAEQMKKQKSGYIMNVSSAGGKVAASFAGVYAASKFGLSGFSEALAKDMSLYGVKVTNICPSMIATQMTKGRKFRADQMLQVSDITKTVGYLLSLSNNAIPTEIIISCLPFIEMSTKATYAVYGLD